MSNVEVSLVPAGRACRRDIPAQSTGTSRKPGNEKKESSSFPGSARECLPAGSACSPSANAAQHTKPQAHTCTLEPEDGRSTTALVLLVEDPEK